MLQLAAELSLVLSFLFNRGLVRSALPLPIVNQDTHGKMGLTRDCISSHHWKGLRQERTGELGELRTHDSKVRR